jgi:hypothetical protein
MAADNNCNFYARATGETVGTYAISAILAPTGVLANYNIANNTQQTLR